MFRVSRGSPPRGTWKEHRIPQYEGSLGPQVGEVHGAGCPPLAIYSPYSWGAALHAGKSPGSGARHIPVTLAAH